MERWTEQGSGRHDFTEVARGREAVKHWPGPVPFGGERGVFRGCQGCWASCRVCGSQAFGISCAAKIQALARRLSCRVPLESLWLRGRFFMLNCCSQEICWTGKSDETRGDLSFARVTPRPASGEDDVGEEAPLEKAPLCQMLSDLSCVKPWCEQLEEALASHLFKCQAPSDWIRSAVHMPEEV